MKNKRQSKIYGGIEVYSKAGKLMFRCDEKKRQWYLSRNLAEAISENAIKLIFDAKGTGEPADILSLEKKNECVVCGVTDYERLTPHHIIPREFRVYFPENLKSHSSLFVVCLCVDCHRKYESEFASNVRKQLRLKYNSKTSKSPHRNPEQIKYLSQLLFRLAADMNHAEAKNKLIASEKYFDYDPSRLDDLEYVHELHSKVVKDKRRKQQTVPFGKIVVDSLDGDYLGFTKIWVDDFFSNMKPNIDREKFDKAVEAFVKNRLPVAAQ